MKMRSSLCCCLLSATIPLGSAPLSHGQEAPAVPPGPPQNKTEVQVTGHILKPADLPPPDPAILKVPDGFRIEKFAENLGNARILAVSPEGRVYVTRREQADVLMLMTGDNGLADGPPQRVAARPGMHGITFHEGLVYLVTVKEIFRAEVKKDGSFGPLEMIVHDLPDAGQHHTRTIQFGPDRRMYVSVGSTCNECNETNPENAAMLRFSPDGKQRQIYAAGLRDTIGWGWHPQTGSLWAMDHGIDWLGDDLQPEELNLIEEGHHYGWPWFFGDNLVNPHTVPPGGVETEEWLSVVKPMVMGYTAHAAPMQLSFYPEGGTFPAEYHGDAFISMRGSWNRKPPSGYEVLRIRFEDGKPVGFEPFISGFITNAGQHGRLCGNAIARDGSLLFTDDRHGILYRVSYTRPAAEKDPDKVVKAPEPPGRPPEPEEEPIAIKAAETKTEGKLEVSSPSYEDGGMIPVMHSAYDQNASMPLKWSAGPEGTKSWVILMDDPDATNALKLPVAHWVAWNIPAETTSLREGMEPSHRQKNPHGMRQGKNYSGKTGYAGPRPPAGDPPHTYHVQIFALDRELDVPAGSGREEVLAAMKGHVLAAGELKGEFKRPENPAKP